MEEIQVVIGGRTASRVISADSLQALTPLLEAYPKVFLVYDRNVAWIPVIRKNFAERPCMVAVGCRHLLSNDGLIAILRREGYTVEPVK